MLPNEYENGFSSYSFRWRYVVNEEVAQRPLNVLFVSVLTNDD